MSAQRTLSNLDVLDVSTLPPCWQAALCTARLEQRLQEIKAHLADEVSRGQTIYPPDPWYALRLTPLKTVKVIILGQDPYHGVGQAHGLAFSVARGVKSPPSLRNIFKEITSDLALQIDPLHAPEDTDLSRWAQQGVLLLNTHLTVREGQAASHSKLGWNDITDAIITTLAQEGTPKAFLLWGAHAQSKIDLVRDSKINHLILCANHPSPLSAHRAPAPFIGCHHFSLTNEWLLQQGHNPIAWL
jgi:uracil-DNA glycosylase